LNRIITENLRGIHGRAFGGPIKGIKKAGRLISRNEASFRGNFWP
jgi:hypothetical protein